MIAFATIRLNRPGEAARSPLPSTFITTYAPHFSLEVTLKVASEKGSDVVK